MRIVRLSRPHEPSHTKVNQKTQMPKVTLAEQQDSFEDRDYAPPRWVVLLTRCVLPPLLFVTLAFTLFPLLLPTIKHHGMTFFTIQPSGQQQQLIPFSKLPVPVKISAHEHAPVHADEIKEAIVQSGNVTLERWLGLEGPSIYVGALQICSKISPNDSITCTSSSKAAYHAAFLPLSLGMTLFALPTAPSCPILLLVSGILSLLASIVFLLGLITWRLPFSINILRRKPRLEAAPHMPNYPGDSDSVRHLVYDEEEGKEKKGIVRVKWGSGPHPAFFCLILAALGVGGGAMIELSEVSKAYGDWDDIQAGEVGLVFQIGSLSYLLPFLPVCLILIIIVGSIPFLWTFFLSKKARFLSRTRSTNVSAAPPEIIVNQPRTEPANGHVQVSFSDSGLITPGGKDKRKSWRNTFGIGVAF
ncbi:uncharacterized protein L203_106290 [Cryptococcus depauperatus CBS 7841]|uniref:Uncharacterized protein n=1 Tax=Cryptococcus depauperatus CBS 7841 TaxID=1295531 RepID=A0A1E3IJT4_9TREE|nr:hypothetical protein L203_02708 [Cryptococcus depauperatus CBS 7841]